MVVMQAKGWFLGCLMVALPMSAQRIVTSACETEDCKSMVSPEERLSSAEQRGCQGWAQIEPVFDVQGVPVSNQFLASYRNDGTESVDLPSLCRGLCLLVDGVPHQRGGWQGW